MIDWFAWAQIGLALAAGIFCLILGLAKRIPTDLSVGLIALVGLLQLVQIAVSAIAPGVGNYPTGNPLEFWVYLGGSFLVPPAAIFWALVERTRWSTVILGLAGLAVSVMLFRMLTIWNVQVA